MALRIEITDRFRKEFGDEAAVEAVLGQVKLQLLGYIKTSPPNARLNFSTTLSVRPELDGKQADTGLPVDDVVKLYSHDGLCDTSLRFVLEHAKAAFEAVPEGPALEIGSFKGGTALALLALHDWPLLITVDPYGSKDYKGGDLVLPAWTGTYGDACYVAHKSNLATAENHAHFLMTGVEFLKRLPITFWRQGEPLLAGNYISGGGFAFAFVDGEHDCETVLEEIGLLLARVARGGRIIVDNIDKDPKLENELVRLGFTVGPEVPWGAKQAVLLC